MLCIFSHVDFFILEVDENRYFLWKLYDVPVSGFEIERARFFTFIFRKK